MPTLHDEVIASPCTRYWLKDIILKLDDHDPVDALYDVETLLKVCEERLKA